MNINMMPELETCVVEAVQKHMVLSDSFILTTCVMDTLECNTQHPDK